MKLVLTVLLALVAVPGYAVDKGRLDPLEVGLKGLRIGAHKNELSTKPELAARLLISKCYDRETRNEVRCSFAADHFTIFGQQTNRVSLVFEKDVLAQITLWISGDSDKPLAPEFYPWAIGALSAAIGQAPSAMSSGFGKEAFFWSNGRNELQVHYVPESGAGYELLINLWRPPARSNRPYATPAAKINYANSSDL
jgi:hypothetical protein